MNNSLSSDFPDPGNPTQATLGGINFHPHKTVYLPKQKLTYPPHEPALLNRWDFPIPTGGTCFPRSLIPVVKLQTYTTCRVSARQPFVDQSLPWYNLHRNILGRRMVTNMFVWVERQPTGFDIANRRLKESFKGVQLLRSCGFSQILNKLTFLNLLCEFFKQELNPKLYWVVTDSEYWASNIFKWSTRKPPWILWHFTAGKQSTSHPNKKKHFTHFLDLPRGAEWMIRVAYTPSLRVQTAPFGRCWLKGLCKFFYYTIFNNHSDPVNLDPSIQ